MSKTDKESLEFKIDRVNTKILEYMNNYVFSRDSDIYSPLISRRSLEDTEISINDKYLISDE